MWDTSCRDWQDRILAGQSLVPDLPLFTAEAERALRVFNRLKLPDVIGQPRMAEAAGDWFRDIVKALFGSYDAETNRRMIQELFILVPKKNGKSSYAAAIMVVALILNRRPNAEYLLIAPTKEIAQIAFKQAWGIIKADPELEKLFWARDNIKMITHRNSGASLQIKAADTDVITGSKSTGILVDETHVFAKKAKAADIFVEIRGALAARPDGFMIQITTQSKEPPLGVFKNELAVARDVRDGLVKLPRLAVLYELPSELTADGGWKDERYWSAVNPNLGRSVDLQFLRNEIITAEMAGAEQVALLASQHFNVEIGMNLRANRWPGADHWETAKDDELSGLGHFEALDRLLERSEVAVIGIDGGGLDDLFGLSVLGREPREIEVEFEINGEKSLRKMKRWLSWSHAWCHKGVLDRRKSIATRLRTIEAARELTILDNPLEDVASIIEIITRIQAEGLLGGVAVDASGLGEMEDALDEIGVTQEAGLLVAAPQGGWMMSSIKGAERRLASGLLKHCGGPLMQWCVPNLKIEPTATGIRATKQSAGDAKIDPAMALFNAVTLMSRNPVAKRAAEYQLIIV
jgi:Phage terminase-like protein, large subunit